MAELNSTNCSFKSWDVYDSDGEAHNFIIHGILISIVALFGLISNAITIYVYSRPQMRTPINCILIGLAVYDIIFILGMFTTRSMPSWPVSAMKIIYPVMYPIVHISYTGSIFMIVLVSFERYVSVCHMREVPIKRIILYTAIVTLFAIICNIPSMMIYKWETIDSTIFTKRTNLGCNESFITLYLTYVLNLVLRYILPTVALIVFNLLIFKKMKGYNDLLKDLNNRTSMVKPQKMTKRIMVIVGIFMLCNSFQVLNNVLKIGILESVADLLLTINSSINGIIYGIFSKNFRDTFLSCHARERNSLSITKSTK